MAKSGAIISPGTEAEQVSLLISVRTQQQSTHARGISVL